MSKSGPIKPKITNQLTKSLHEYLKSQKLKKILLVTGNESFAISGAEKKILALNAEIEFLRWSEFSPNPNHLDLAKGIRIARKFKPDAIIGIGGGSALDLAKMISVKMGGNESDDLKLEIFTKTVKLILIPTTAGSGSEATHFSVLYVNGKKHSIASKQQYADMIILDSELIISNSPSQKALSGIDALAQAIESLWAKGANKTSTNYAEKSLKIINRSLRDFVRNPNKENAEGMLIGSHIAGRAIDISKTTGPHAFSYEITSRFGVPHGNAVALTLGAFIDLHNARINDSKKLKKAMKKVNALVGINSKISGKKYFENLLQEFDLISNFSELKIGDAEKAQIIESINYERMSNNPIQLTNNELIALFRY